MVPDHVAPFLAKMIILGLMFLGGHHEKSVRQERSIERQGPEDKNQRSRKTQTAAYFYKREGQEVIDPENSRTSYEQEGRKRAVKACVNYVWSENVYYFQNLADGGFITKLCLFLLGHKKQERFPQRDEMGSDQSPHLVNCLANHFRIGSQLQFGDLSCNILFFDANEILRGVCRSGAEQPFGKRIKLFRARAETKKTGQEF